MANDAVLAEAARGGTAYPSLVVAGRREADQTFVALLEKLASGRAPAATPQSVSRADTSLNAAFQNALRNAPACTVCDTNPNQGGEGLRDAQRAWIRYRDAWTAFYTARWQGSASPDALRREILLATTLARTAFLRALVQPK